MLSSLVELGLAVPASLVCTWQAHMRFQAGDAGVLGELRLELERMLRPDRAYAVRSSANVEDHRQHSFAGQFKTVLNVQGVEGVLRAIQRVWSSASSEAVLAYLDRAGMAGTELKMAVIIQEMVVPVVSGVSFSKNPITGLDEVVVEAVPGSGEALVQEGVTPWRWINKWGAWIEQPEASTAPSAGQADLCGRPERNGAASLDPHLSPPSVDLDIIRDVVCQTKTIARKVGCAVDLEWVYDGREVQWLQLREITASDVPVYSDRISREVFPGIIKPLVWSVNVPLVNGAWVRLLTELIGPNDLEPESLAETFYYRAYFNMGTLGDVFEVLGLPREALELLMGVEAEGPERPSFKPTRRTYALLPRLIWTALTKLRFGRQVKASLPRMTEGFRQFERKPVGEMGEADLLDEIVQLDIQAQETAYYNIVTPLLMMIYNRLLRVQLERAGVAFEDFDLTRGMAELEEFQPDVHLARLQQQYRALDDEPRARIRRSTYQEFQELTGIEEFQRGVAGFLAKFGHLSDSGNDFSSVPWRENPDLILGIIVEPEHQRTTVPESWGSTSVAFGDRDARQGSAPRERQKMGLEDLHLSRWRRGLLRIVYGRAREFRWHREAVSSLYTYGYGLFRHYFVALGERFVGRGLLGSREDIFYLSIDEVRRLIGDCLTREWAQRIVAERKRDIEQMSDFTPPGIIYGKEVPPLSGLAQGRLSGIPTSRGRYTGPVKVLQGLHDFAKLEDGDVLVIPYSDVGWTPLFARAGAVVAQSGGILSHSSIVAREYGIPAVVSVPGACQLLDRTIVTVDGYRGEVVIHRDSESDLDS